MRNLLEKTALAVVIFISFLAFLGNFNQIANKKETQANQQQEFQVITGIINR